MPYFDLSPSYHQSGNLNTVIPDTPGSSVFDLPTQFTRAGEEWLRRPTPNAQVNKHQNGDANQLDHRSTYHPDTSFVVVSGGTGCNAICSAFGPNTCYVIPVSDDGGSSSEIIRVLGGPSIGDIRSRLIRLIPPTPPSSPLGCIRNLLAYRLPTTSTEREARDEWRDVVEGRSPLWAGIPNDRKEMIRSLLVYFESEVLKRAHKNFSFRNGSIGNYFLSAATEFFRSLPSAIFLFSSITNSQANILPVIVTNHTVTIAVELENGTRLVGQCEISHPVPTASTLGLSITVDEDLTSPTDALGGIIGRPNNILFESTKKDHYEPLDANIVRLLYINAYGNEIHPSPNPDYVHSLGEKDVLIYSCGSLWTSIVPCLALRGVASAIARSRSLRAKVLLLNTQNDRETSGYKAIDYIRTIARTLNASYHPQSYGGLGGAATTYPVSAFVTHLVYLRNTSIDLEKDLITELGVRCVEVDGPVDERSGLPKFDAECVRRAIVDILSEDEKEHTP